MNDTHVSLQYYLRIYLPKASNCSAWFVINMHCSTTKPELLYIIAQEIRELMFFLKPNFYVVNKNYEVAEFFDNFLQKTLWKLSWHKNASLSLLLR